MASKASSSFARQRIAEQVAPFRGHAIAADLARRGIDRGDRRLVALEQRQAARPSERQRADAGEQIRELRRIADPGIHRGAHRRLAALGRLQEAARRRLDRGVAQEQQRRAARHDRLGRGAIAPAQAREAGAFGELDQRLPPVDRQVEPPVRPDQHVDPAIRLVRDGIGSRAIRQDFGQRRAQRRKQRRERRPRDHAAADIDDPRAGPFVETGQHPPALAAQHEVDPPPLARLAEQRSLEGRRRHAALLQRALDQADLPGGVGVAPPVLQRAAAAHA